ncbi:MAG: hypothetical protein WD379_05515 [Dehalococcoidia bacterium]
MGSTQSLSANKISKWYLGSDVSLEFNERVIYEGHFLRSVGLFSVYGALFLTPRRLVWTRYRLTIPLGAETITIPLDSVTRVSAGRHRWFGPYVLVIETDVSPEGVEFVPLRGKPEAENWLDVLDQVLNPAGIEKESDPS